MRQFLYIGTYSHEGAGHRSKMSFLNYSSLLFFETVSHCLPQSPTPPAQVVTIVIDASHSWLFYPLGAEDTNSGPHACKAQFFKSNMSLDLPCMVFLSLITNDEKAVYIYAS